MHFFKADRASFNSLSQKTRLNKETLIKISTLSDLFPENKDLFAQFSINLANNLFMEDLKIPHEFLLKFQFAVEEMREGKRNFSLKPLPNKFEGQGISFYKILFEEGLEKIADALLDKETAKEVKHIFPFIKNQMMFP